MTHRYLLSHLIPASAATDPGAIAAVCGDERLTWSQLDRRVGSLAAALAARGVRGGDRVGVYLHKSLESLVGVHGVLRAGAAYVPIDPMAPAELLAGIVADCGITTIVTHELRRQGVERLAESTPLSSVVGLDDLPWEDVDRFDPIDPVPVQADDLAYVMYTSGSTGAPKGIMHTHRSGLNYAIMSADLYGLGPDDRVANFSPLHFDMSTFEIFAGVAAGARVVLVPEPHLRLPASLTAYLADEGCTTLYTVPSLFQQMMSRGALAERDRSAVRWVLPAGEVFPPEPLRELMALFPHARFSNVYGPAEVNQCTYFHFGSSDVTEQPVPVGFACPDAELSVVDETGGAVADGERGELLVRTGTMMAGYWGRPDLDERGFVFCDGPGGQRQRWYRTGDLVSVNDRGELEFHGRLDNQVKIRGHRVELESVEAAVGSLPEVEQAVVGVRAGAAGDHQLVARIIPDEGVDLDAEAAAWRRTLAARLPAYAVPSAFESADRFPLTPSGKIDRRRVRESIADQA